MCGEGPRDVGKRDYQTQHWIDGPAILIFKVALKRQCKHNCCVIGIERKELRRIPFQKRKGKGIKGHGIKAYQLALYARKRGIKFAICYVDCDIHDFNELYSEIRNGFEKVTKVRGIAMVPMKMIESWILADENAYPSYAGKYLKIPDYLPDLKKYGEIKQIPIATTPKMF